MIKKSVPAHGTVAWRELQTQNVETAKEFYSQLLGWETPQNPRTEFPYALAVANGVEQGGILEINASWGEGWESMPSHWVTYIAVDDCDAAFEAIKANGGSTFCAPFDAPNVGRICIAADPAGAMFSIIQFVRE